MHAVNGNRQNNSPHAQTTYNYNQDTPKRLSSKQLSFLHRLAKDQAMTRQELGDMTGQRFGCKPEFLTARDASVFINELLQATNAA